jgi:hypothetical protein
MLLMENSSISSQTVYFLTSSVPFVYQIISFSYLSKKKKIRSFKFFSERRIETNFINLYLDGTCNATTAAFLALLGNPQFPNPQFHKPSIFLSLFFFFLFSFNSLYTWTPAFLAPLVISFNDFLVLFSLSS